MGVEDEKDDDEDGPMSWSLLLTSVNQAGYDLG